MYQVVLVCVLGVLADQFTHGMKFTDWKSISDDLPYEYRYSLPSKTQRYMLGGGGMSMNWYEARKWCQQHGAGDLLTITSQREADEIKKLLQPSRTSNFIRYTSYWVGLQNLNKGVEWTWYDGSKFDKNIISMSFYTDVDYKSGCASMLVTDSIHLGRRHCADKALSDEQVFCKRDKNQPSTISTVSDLGWMQYLPVNFYDNLPTTCKEGFIELPTKCVKLVNAIKLTWIEAERYCSKTYGNRSNLVSFHEDLEVYELKVKAKSLVINEHWIGLRSLDLFYEDQSIQWTDESFTGYIPFLQNKTQRHLEQVHFSPETCYYLQFSSNKKPNFLKSKSCIEKKHFICQIYKREPTINRLPFDNSTNCPDGFTGRANKCYKVVSTPNTFDKAELDCQKQQNTSNLASVESFEDSFILRQLQKIYNISELWIGLKLTSKNNIIEPGRMLNYWTNGNPVFYEELDKQQTNQHLNICAKITSDFEMWNVTSCQDTLPFICQLTLNDSKINLKRNEDTFCLTNWYQFNGNCYYIEKDNRVTWKNAVEKCIHLNSNSTLANFNTDQERQYILYQIEGNLNRGLWIGIYKNKIGEPTAIDGSKFIYSNINSSQDENCAKLSSSSYSRIFTWDDCNQKHGFICKMPPIDHSDLSFNLSSSVCPNNKWVYRNGFCYLFLPDAYYNWRHANQICNTSKYVSGSDREVQLVSIHSELENHFVQVILQAKTKLPFHRWSWIGYYGKKEKWDDITYKWNWTDDGQGDYQNWEYNHYSFMANHSKESFKCVAMETLSGKWAVKPCTDVYGTVCKLAAHNPEQTPKSTIITTNEIITTTNEPLTTLNFTSVHKQNLTQSPVIHKNIDSKSKENKKEISVLSLVIIISTVLCVALAISIALIILRRKQKLQLFCLDRKTFRSRESNDMITLATEPHNDAIM